MMRRRTLRLTADKRQNFIMPKLPSATAFIRKPLSAHCGQRKGIKNEKEMSDL